MTEASKVVAKTMLKIMRENKNQKKNHLAAINKTDVEAVINYEITS